MDRSTDPRPDSLSRVEPHPADGLDERRTGSRHPPGSPIVLHPLPEAARAVVVSIPHLGTAAWPGTGADDFARPDLADLAILFADPYAGAVYAGLHRAGATVVGTAISRLFVDLNRRRDSFAGPGGTVRSRTGVVRTHTRRGEPIFARPLGPRTLEARLRAGYDPYYRALERTIGTLRRAGRVLVLDGHTANPRRLGGHDVVLGTRGGRTAAPAATAAAERAFARAGFEVAHDVPGYRGGNLVRVFGAPEAGVDAVQVEINAGLLFPPRGSVRRGRGPELPPPRREVLARLHAALAGLVARQPRLGAAPPLAVPAGSG